MEEKNKKNNFFNDIFKSIKDLDKYEDFALESSKNAFKYFLKLVLIFVIIITLFFSYKIVYNFNKTYSNLKESLPDFSYSEGALQVDSQEPIVITEYEKDLGKVIIDTNIEITEIEKYENEIGDNSLGIILLKDRIIMLSNSANGQVAYKYSDIVKNYNITEFTKQDVTNYIESINIISIYASISFVLVVYLFIIYLILIFIDVLALTLLAIIVARLSKIKFKFTPAFNVAVHGITLSVLLNLIYIIVNLLTGFNIKYFGFMYNTISYIYIVVAVLMIKTDFINRQLELIKLAEEQEKVRQELKKQKDEEEKQENKKDEKEDKEKTSKRKKKSNEDDAGANAPACQETGE